MIYGIGVDTATTARLEKSMKNETFLSRVYGEAERAFFESKKFAAESAAANFAAKEALGKALGVGIFGAFSLCEVQALRNEKGAPYFLFTGKAAQFMQSNHFTAHLSLTHEAGAATAFVIVEQAQE